MHFEALMTSENQQENTRKWTISHLKDQGIHMRKYIKSEDLRGARTLFAYNSKTMFNIKLNQMNHEPFSKVNWTCNECTSVLSSIHIKWCPAYSHLRENLSLERDEDLILYLQQVIQLRKESDDKQNSYAYLHMLLLMTIP